MESAGRWEEKGLRFRSRVSGGPAVYTGPKGPKPYISPPLGALGFRGPGSSNKGFGGLTGTHQSRLLG